MKTPEERAVEVRTLIGLGDGGQRVVAEAIRKAVAEEREACAVFLETAAKNCGCRGRGYCDGMNCGSVEALASDIRARSDAVAP